MEYYTVQEKIQIVKWYYQGKTLRKIVALFPGAFENRAIPSLKTVSRVIKNFENHGCVSPRNHKHEPVFDENRELKHVMICATVNDNPLMSSTQIAEVVGTSPATVKRVLKKNGFRLNRAKITEETSPNKDTVEHIQLIETEIDDDNNDHFLKDLLIMNESA